MNYKPTKKEINFQKHCETYGFNNGHYKTKICIDGVAYSLIGFNPRRPINTCILKEIYTGKLYNMNPEIVRKNIIKP